MTDLGEIIGAMLHAISTAENPTAAWKGAITASGEMAAVIPVDLQERDGNTEVAVIVAHLQRIFRNEALPAGLTFLYFGLFGAVYTDSETEVAGFYISGGISADAEPSVERPADLTYFPDDRFIRSQMLDRIKVEALRGGENYNFFDYALMLGAAAMLAKFALRALEIQKTLIVGFDSGDRLIVT